MHHRAPKAIGKSRRQSKAPTRKNIGLWIKHDLEAPAAPFLRTAAKTCRQSYEMLSGAEQMKLFFTAQPMLRVIGAARLIGPEEQLRERKVDGGI